jgi:hypothetical protein
MLIITIALTALIAGVVQPEGDQEKRRRIEVLGKLCARP